MWSRYENCETCGCKTLTRDTKVLKHASEWSEGMKKEISTCKCCGRYEERKIKIPRKMRRQRHSSHGGSSGSGGFSGGSSGGGGAGSSW